MLGAAENMASMDDVRVRARPEGDVPAHVFLQKCDIWVFQHAAHWRETACVAMLEAMATGLPVLVDGLGGMREYLEHGRTGFMCNDVAEFAAFTTLLFECPRLYARMSARARSFVESAHSVESLSRRLGELTIDT